MTEILTAAQMRSIEQAAIESGEVSGLELMERAGQGVVDAIFEEWPEFAEVGDTELGDTGGVAPRPAASPQGISAKKRRAVVLCGPGNNGGDGFVVARLLQERGWEVEVFLYGEAEKLPPDARVNYERWVEIGDVVPLTAAGFRAPHPVHGRAFADVYVDALFGTGITRPVSGEAWDVLAYLGGSGGDNFSDRIVAIDAPSGVCLDSGRLLGSDHGYAHEMNRFAALTVAFDSPKLGHFLGEGPGLCGKLVIKDIGLRRWRETEFRQNGGKRSPLVRQPDVVLVDATPMVADSRAWCRPVLVPEKNRHRGAGGHAHKFSYGHALIVTGGAGHTGAARLSARAALRVGAGLVSLAVPREAMAEVAAQITALMMREVSGAVDLLRMLSDERLTAVCIGPGLGLGQARAEMVGAVLQSGRATVLDADALSLIARSDALRAQVHERCVLTPHMGEFARLFPDIHARLTAPKRPSRTGDAIADHQALMDYRTKLQNMTGPAYSKVDAVREAAARIGGTVVLKGPDTVIATPQGRTAVHAAVYDRAAPWLATAGSGDVLAGLITGLLAMGYPPFDAATTAAWLHVECARAFGPGLIAEDLPEVLPKVLHAHEKPWAGR